MLLIWEEWCEAVEKVRMKAYHRFSGEEKLLTGVNLMIVEPLSQATIAGTSKLVYKIFGNEGFPFTASKELRASLSPEENRNFLKKAGVRKLIYYVALNEATKDVMGVIGQYEELEDPLGVVWIGWFCVSPAFRGRKVGESLLIWNVQNAREKGYRTMKVQTSDHSGEKAAQGLYDKLGFKVKEVQPVEGKGYRLLYRERQL